MTSEDSVMLRVQRLANGSRMIADLRTGAEARSWSRAGMNHEMETLARHLQPVSLFSPEVSGDEWDSFLFKAYTRTAHVARALAQSR